MILGRLTSRFLLTSPTLSDDQTTEAASDISISSSFRALGQLRRRRQERKTEPRTIDSAVTGIILADQIKPFIQGGRARNYPDIARQLKLTRP